MALVLQISESNDRFCTLIPRPDIHTKNLKYTYKKSKIYIQKISDYYELGIDRPAFLSLEQFLRQKLQISGVEKEKKKQSKETADQANVYLIMNCACFWLFLARVGQKFTNVQRDGPTKDNILNFPNWV